MSRILLLVLLVAAAGAGLAFLLGEHETRPDDGPANEPVALGPGDVEVESAAPREDPDVALAAPREDAARPVETQVGTTVIYPLEVELTLALQGSVPRRDDVMVLGTGAVARLVGSLRDGAGKPTQGVCRFVAGPNEGRELRTDAQGRFGASDLWQGLALVRVETAVGLATEREVRLRQLAETQLHVSFAMPAHVSGIVTDGQGEPIEGAEIRLDGKNGYSDVEGRFSFPRVTPGKVLAVVRKDGYALQRQSFGVPVRGEVTEENLRFTLRPAALLRLHVAESIGARAPSVAYLFPAGGAREGTLERGFPWHEVNPVEIPQGGVATVEGLPADSLSVHVFHPGAVATPPSVHVKLYPGRTVTKELHLTSAPVVQGVVTRDGEPVPGARVRLEAPDRGTATTKALGEKPTYALELVVPHVPSALQEARADGAGRFTLTAFPGISSGYYLTAESPDGRARATRLVDAGTEGIELALRPVDEARGTLAIELPGRFQGLPVEVRVQGAPRDPLLLRAGEPLVIDGLEQGTWRVRASWRGTFVVRSQLVEVGPDGGSVEGTLPEGAIRGQSAAERERANR